MADGISGEFCWVELMTTDKASAKAFYGAVFGWTAGEDVLADGGTYTRLGLAEGGDAAGLYQMSESLRAQRVPPHWSLHVAVDDADRAAARAAELGGGVVSEPFEVSDAGRMAMLQDPTGALINVWQPRSHRGFPRQGPARGRFLWGELTTSDRDKAERFYGGLFGWQVDHEDEGPMRYATLVTQGGKEVAAMLQLPPEWRRIPSHWLPYFGAPDAAAAAQAVTRAGGSVMTPPTVSAGRGRFAVARDPQTAAFGVLEAR